MADPNVKIICHPQNDEENSYEWMKKAESIQSENITSVLVDIVCLSQKTGLKKC